MNCTNNGEPTRAATSTNEKILELQEYLKKLLEVKEDKDRLKKERLAILIHLDRNRNSLVEVLTELEVTVIEGKLNNIIEALKAQDVFLLKGGALEHYLPSYTGNIYEISDSVKKQTIEKEIEILFATIKVEDLETRYGYLFEIIKALPAEPKVDYLRPIKNHLGSFIYNIQKGIQLGLLKSAETIPNYIGNDWNSLSRILEITSLNVVSNTKFTCIIKILDKWGLGEMTLTINEKTNSSMGQFDLIKNVVVQTETVSQ